VHGGRLALLTVIPACTVLLLAGLAACSRPGPFDAPPCFPPAYTVTPERAQLGQNVNVTAPDADCDPRYGEHARIHVTVTDAAGTKVLDATSAMNDAGGFTYTFIVPVNSAAGAATVTAMPYNIDWCDDTGRNNRAGGSGQARELTRVSCAQPVRILTITP
jgi:hypothetical protein